jgi:hypothetical protein
MTKYVLLYTGAKVPPADIKAIKALPGIMVTKTIRLPGACMMHVEGPVSVKRAVSKMPDWVASEKTTYEVPDPHVGLRTSASKREK